MKKCYLRILAIFAAFITTTPAAILAQNGKHNKKIKKPLVIAYDFNNPADSTKDSTKYARPGQNIVLILRNINPNTYNVSVNDSIVVYETQKPDQFDNFFSKMPELKPVTATTDTVKKLGGAGAAALPGPVRAADSTNAASVNAEDEKLKILINDGYPNLKSEIKNLINYADIPDNISKISVNCGILQEQRITDAKAYLVTRVAELTDVEIPVGIKSRVAAKYESVKNNISDFLAEAIQLKKIYESLKKQTAAIPGITVSRYDEIAGIIDGKIVKINDAADNIKKLAEKLDEFEKLDVGKKIEAAYNSILTAQITKVVRKYIPRKSGDEYLLKVNIEKKQPAVNCVTDPASFTIPVYVEKGIKIDFSTGVVFNFGRKKFFDQRYRYDSVYRPDGKITDSVKITNRPNNNVTQISIAAFGHFYTRVRNDFNIGGLFGISLGTDQRLYYHAGLSALIGKNDRFVISSGVSFAKAKYLDSQYDNDQILKRNLSPTVIPNEEVLRAGYFIGLSYNLNLIK